MQASEVVYGQVLSSIGDASSFQSLPYTGRGATRRGNSVHDCSDFSMTQGTLAPDIRTDWQDTSRFEEVLASDSGTVVPGTAYSLSTMHTHSRPDSCMSMGD